jgi:hypothetical protein
VGEYLFMLCTCVHREKTALNVCVQDVEDCPHSEINMLGTSTEISPRATHILLSIPPVDVEFRDTTLKVPVGKYGRREYLCVLLRF